MNHPAILRMTAALTGLVMAGEAIALLVGMHLLSGPANPWISAKNDWLLALDIVCGLGLIGLAWKGSDALGSNVFWFCAGMGLVSHGYRAWEYAAQVADRFLFNAPLFWVNAAKILALLLLAVLGFRA